MDGWNASVANSSASTITLQWPKLTSVLGKQVRAYLAIVENTRGDKVAGDVLFPNVTSAVIEGLNTSSDYRLFAVAIDALGQLHKSLQVSFSTREGGEYLEGMLDEKNLKSLYYPLRYLLHVKYLQLFIGPCLNNRLMFRCYIHKEYNKIDWRVEYREQKKRQTLLSLAARGC